MFDDFWKWFNGLLVSLGLTPAKTAAIDRRVDDMKWNEKDFQTTMSAHRRGSNQIQRAQLNKQAKHKEQSNCRTKKETYQKRQPTD